MKIQILSILSLVGLWMLPLGTLQAATIEQTMAQVNVYAISGDISDPGLASSLSSILSSAKSRRDAGDSEGQANYLEAFRDTVVAASGDLITAAAGSALAAMAP